MRTGEGLVAVLGWSPDDFESAAREVDSGVLEVAKRILLVTSPGEDERTKQLSLHAVRFIDDLLVGNDGRYWERSP